MGNTYYTSLQFECTHTTGVRSIRKPRWTKNSNRHLFKLFCWKVIFIIKEITLKLFSDERFLVAYVMRRYFIDKCN